MYRFQLSRKEVTCKDDPATLRYNYYILGYIDAELVKQELIHRSLAMPDALTLVDHDCKARSIYNDFLERKELPHGRGGRSEDTQPGGAAAPVSSAPDASARDGRLVPHGVGE